MANPTWPGTVPIAPLLDSFSEEISDFNAEFQPDAGLPSTWPRSSAARLQQPWRMLITTAQRAALYTFWKTTTAFGSLPFDITDPVTEGTVTSKFTGPLRFIPSGSTPRPWIVEFTLIRLA
jgi:hypothetical protein